MNTMKKLECLDFKENVLNVLLDNSRIRDKERFFAKMRNPSKLTQLLIDDLNCVFEERGTMVF